MNEITPHWEEKNWGDVFHIFATDKNSLSCLKLQAGQCCSLHKHHDRANMFALVDAHIVVELYGTDGTTKTDIVNLNPGMSYTVPSGIWHKFRVISPGTLVEVYWSDTGNPVRLDDIVRQDVGHADPVKDILQDLREFHGLESGE